MPFVRNATGCDLRGAGMAPRAAGERRTNVLNYESGPLLFWLAVLSLATSFADRAGKKARLAGRD
jgi:hypothetical protein